MSGDAVVLGFGGDAVGLMAGAFFLREGEQAFSGDEGRQMFGLLAVRSGGGQERGAEQRGRQQRRRRQRSSRRLHHLGQPLNSEIGAAVVFRDKKSGPAEFGHFAP